nr:acyltransferase [uncultured Sphaerochaeta sp.]
MNYPKNISLLFLFSILVFMFFFIASIICLRYKKKKEIVSTRENYVGKNRNIGISKYLIGYVRYVGFIIARIPSYSVRNFLYRKVLRMNITKNTIIFGECEFRSPWNITIGDSVIGQRVMIDARGGVEIGNSVDISSDASLWTSQHIINSASFLSEIKPIVVQDYSWICSRSLILPGVTIKKGAVIVAGAVVTSDCNAYSVYAGVPAKIIATRNDKLSYRMKKTWHFW